MKMLLAFTCILLLANFTLAGSIRDISDLTISKSASAQPARFLVLAQSTNPQKFESFIQALVAAGAQKSSTGHEHVFTHPLARLEWKQNQVNPANGFRYSLQFELAYEDLVSIAAASGLPTDPLFIEFQGPLAQALYEAMVTSDVPPVDESYFNQNLKCEKTIRQPLPTCTLVL